MSTFVSTSDLPPIDRDAEHGGVGPVQFRRLLASSDLASNIDFVDYTVIPPGSTIGRHFHEDTEELYYIVKGDPLVEVNGDQQRLHRHDVAVVHPGQWHALTNDTRDDVAIFVVQAHL